MDEFNKKDAPGPRIVFFDDEETWSLLCCCWVGYPNAQQYKELEEGAYPKHLDFVKEPLEQMVDPIDPPPDGKEAEELRAGIERLIAFDHEEAVDLRQGLRNLLDRVDARDSLGYLKALDDAAIKGPPAATDGAKPTGHIDIPFEEERLLQLEIHKRERAAIAEYYDNEDERAVALLLHERAMQVDEHVRAAMVLVWRAAFQEGRKSVLGDPRDGDEGGVR